MYGYSEEQRLKQAHEFSMEWPEARMDAVLAETRELLATQVELQANKRRPRERTNHPPQSGTTTNGESSMKTILDTRAEDDSEVKAAKAEALASATTNEEIAAVSADADFRNLCAEAKLYARSIMTGGAKLSDYVRSAMTAGPGERLSAPLESVLAKLDQRNPNPANPLVA